MAKAKRKVSRQERKQRRILAEKKRKQVHFEKQIQFTKNAQSFDAEFFEPIPKQKVSLRVPAPLLNDFDFMAAEMGISRSELIIHAMLNFKPVYLQTGDYGSALED